MELDVRLENGLLPDRFGKYCPAADRDDCRLSRRSFPFVASEVPYGTQALAWVLLDWDSVPVCGFPWIHWCAVLGDVAAEAGAVAIPEDVSRKGMPGLAEGHNSLKLADGSFGVGYVGPCPPDATHDYTLHAAALDAVPDLANAAAQGRPFWANELVRACRSHVLAEASLPLPSRS